MAKKLFQVSLLAAVFAVLLAGLQTPPSAAAAAPADPGTKAYLGFFPVIKPEGSVPVKLVPHPQVVGQIVQISFGMPFPPGYVKDPAQIALLDNIGQEIPIHVSVLARWLPPVHGAPSLRAVLIQYRDLIGSRTPRIYTVRWGKPRQQKLARGWEADRGWLPVADGSYPRFTVKDPPVWAMFPPTWLCQSLVKGRLAPAGTFPSYRWLEVARAGYYQQAINHPVLTKRLAAMPGIKKRVWVNYAKHYEPWLFDRTTTIFIHYLTTGWLGPLAYALRDVQYYAANVQENGNFALLKPGRSPNVIYGNQEALTLGWFFSGLPKLKRASARVVKLLDAWNPEYSPSRTFWTERHLAFHLMIATAAYEMTGNPALLKRARRAFEIGYHMQTNPPPGAPADGCLIHTGEQHSSGVKGWTCSPWMSVLFVDAALRYYLVSADPRVPKSVMMLADYLVNVGTYRYQPKNTPISLTYPYYMASSFRQSQKMVSTDREHTLDVCKILALAIYFARKQGLPTAAYQKLYGELIFHAKRLFPIIKPGREVAYLLNPRRKFNWWFRTTADIPWLIEQGGP